MSSGLELYESRVSRLDLADGTARLHFSHAYIYKAKGTPGRDPGTGWSQEAELVMEEAVIDAPLPPLPNMIAGGFLELEGERHEVIPLPLAAEGSGRLHLVFDDGSVLDIAGNRPAIHLLGKAIALEDFT